MKKKANRKPEYTEIKRYYFYFLFDFMLILNYSYYMSNVPDIAQSTDALMNLLKASVSQSTEMAEKLIKINVQNTVNINQLEGMGNIIDTYA